MSTPFRGRYSPASRGGGGNNSGGGGRGGNSEYRGRGGAGGSRGGGQYSRGGGRGGGDRGGGFQRGRGGGEGGRGGGFSRGGHGGSGGDREAPKKENILDLGQYLDREIYVKFNGGREVSGTLKGYDQLLNMVLDDAQEKMRNAEGEVKSRSLGLAVIRGTHITTLYPVDGSESISNPYLAAAEEDDGDDDAPTEGQSAASKITPAYQYTPKADEEESD